MNNQPTQPPRIIEVYVCSTVDKLFSELGYGGRFTTLLPQGSEIGLSTDERIQGKKLSFKVQNIQLPNVLYNFPSKASKFHWEDDFSLNTMVGSSVETIQIDTSRVYSAPSDLITELNSKIQAVDISLAFSYSDTTKKITLTNNNTTKKIRVISSYKYANVESVLTGDDCMEKLGFAGNYVDLLGVVDEAGGTLTGNGLIQMNRTNNYHLALRESGASYSQTLVPSKPGRGRIIANIPTGSFGTLSTLAYISPEWFQIPISNKLSELHFELYDDEFDSLAEEIPPNYGISLSLQFKIE